MSVHVGNFIDVPLVDPRLAEAAGVDFVELRTAVRHVGETLQQEWVRLASGEFVNRSSGAYVNGIRGAESLSYPYEGNPLAVGVFNVARHAAAIEYGHAAFNLAERIRWGRTSKSRLSKGGRWYIVVPFRHYTKGRVGEGATPGREARAMPTAIHEIVKRMDFGERLTFDMGRLSRGRWAAAMSHKGREVGAMRGVGPSGARLVSPTSARAQAFGEPTTRSSRSFGAHLLAAATGRAPGPPALHHQSSMYEGMVKSGSPRHEQYMTFRVITQGSQWWIPAQTGAHVAERVATTMGPAVREALAEGFRVDVERAIAAALAGGR